MMPSCAPGKVRRGDLEGLDGGREALLTAGLAGFEVVAVKVHQRELGGDEESGTDRQDEADAEHDPFIHSGAPLPWWPVIRSEGRGARAYVKEGHP